MTPAAFRADRFALGLSTSGFAQALNIETRTVQRYEDGTRAVPGSVERLVEVLMQSAQARELCGLKAYPAPKLPSLV